MPEKSNLIGGCQSSRMSLENMPGAELSARFALPPNSKRYCGTGEFAGKFADYLQDKCASNRIALENSLRKFTAHYAYLKLIADANGLEPFDAQVAEALWIGSRLLENVEKKEMQKLIMRQFVGEEKLSAAKAKKLAEGMPDGFVPHHSFHVLYIHTISGVIEPSVKNADLCRPSWGKVISGDGKGAVLKSQKLLRQNGKLALQECKSKAKTSCAGIALLPELKKGSTVASHWGVAVMELSESQAKRMERYTKNNIAAANSMNE